MNQNYTTLSLRDALEKELLTALSTDFDTLEDNIDALSVRIYDGDVTLPEALDLYDLYYEQNIAGIIVNGNLTVTGPVIDFELDTYSCFLLVTMLLRRKGHHNLTGHSSRTCRTTAVGKKGAVVIAETNSAITKRHFVPSQIKASAENRLVSELESCVTELMPSCH